MFVITMQCCVVVCDAQYNQIDEDDVNSPTKAKITTRLVLEVDEDKEPLVEVYQNLIRKLKPHQVEGTPRGMVEEWSG